MTRTQLLEEITKRIEVFGSDYNSPEEEMYWFVSLMEAYRVLAYFLNPKEIAEIYMIGQSPMSDKGVDD